MLKSQEVRSVLTNQPLYFPLTEVEEGIMVIRTKDDYISLHNELKKWCQENFMMTNQEYTEIINQRLNSAVRELDIELQKQPETPKQFPPSIPHIDNPNNIIKEKVKIESKKEDPSLKDTQNQEGQVWTVTKVYIYSKNIQK